MVDADIVVSSTGCPQTILHRPDVEKLMHARHNRPLFMIDIAVPRDIDPTVQELDNVYLYNIDDLEAIVRDNVRHRERDLALCHEIIDKKITALMPRLAGGAEDNHDTRLQPQPSWLPHGAAAISS
jgi:glutamyl-tRNA reductase